MNEWRHVTRDIKKSKSFQVSESARNLELQPPTLLTSQLAFLYSNLLQEISINVFLERRSSMFCDIFGAKLKARLASSLASEIVYFDGFYVVSRRKRSFSNWKKVLRSFIFIGLLRNQLNIRASEQHAGFNGRKWSRNVQVFLFLMMSSLMWASEPERHDRESLCNQHVCSLSFS